MSLREMRGRASFRQETLEAEKAEDERSLTGALPPRVSAPADRARDGQ